MARRTGPGRRCRPSTARRPVITRKHSETGPEPLCQPGAPAGRRGPASRPPRHRRRARRRLRSGGRRAGSAHEPAPAAGLGHRSRRAGAARPEPSPATSHPRPTPQAAPQASPRHGSRPRPPSLATTWALGPPQAEALVGHADAVADHKRSGRARSCDYPCPCGHGRLSRCVAEPGGRRARGPGADAVRRVVHTVTAVAAAQERPAATSVASPAGAGASSGPANLRHVHGPAGAQHDRRHHSAVHDQADPLGSDLVVATPRGPRRCGARLAGVCAPSDAGRTSAAGAARIDVQAITARRSHRLPARSPS